MIEQGANDAGSRTFALSTEVQLPWQRRSWPRASACTRIRCCSAAVVVAVVVAAAKTRVVVVLVAASSSRLCVESCNWVGRRRSACATTDIQERVSWAILKIPELSHYHEIRIDDGLSLILASLSTMKGVRRCRVLFHLAHIRTGVITCRVAVTFGFFFSDCVLSSSFLSFCLLLSLPPFLFLSRLLFLSLTDRASPSVCAPHPFILTRCLLGKPSTIHAGLQGEMINLRTMSRVFARLRTYDRLLSRRPRVRARQSKEQQPWRAGGREEENLFAQGQRL